MEVFDNSIRVLKDPYARRPVVRAGSLASRPANIGEDYAVYYAGDTVVGYRDLDGNFFDAAGNEVEREEIVILSGKARQTGGNITDELFTDYTPRARLLPRIGVGARVLENFLLFANYGRFRQRPRAGVFAPLSTLEGASTIGNNDLEPIQSTEYEAGIRYGIDEQTGLMVAGFFRRIKDLPELGILVGAAPADYVTYR